MNFNTMNISNKNQKLPKEWKWAKAKEGHMVRLPSILRLSPNKYSPGKVKATKNVPHCLNVGPSHFGCKSCMWKEYACHMEERNDE